jgi:hypothetical protein
MCYYITWQLTLAEFRLGLEGDDGRASEWERDAWRFICIPFALILTDILSPEAAYGRHGSRPEHDQERLLGNDHRWGASSVRP